MEWERDGYVVSDDAARIDRAWVAAWLSTRAYWAIGRPSDLVDRSIEGSLNLGLYAPDGRQVGFCRWVTDRATFGWLCDVFVDEAARGRGLGTWLVGLAVAHPAVSGIKRQLLATNDAHGLYAKLGFRPLELAERWMERPAETSSD